MGIEMTEPEQTVNDQLLGLENATALNFVAETNYIEPNPEHRFWIAEFSLKSGGLVKGTGDTDLEAGIDALNQVAAMYADELA